MNKFYTTNQYEEFADEDNNSCRLEEDQKTFAKILQVGFSQNMKERTPKYNKYFIRTNSNKDLYDPFPLYSISDNKASFVNKVCKTNETYKEVTESIFNLYLNYLRTENAQWYNKAKREVKNL
jgi:hypothetical protein